MRAQIPNHIVLVYSPPIMNYIILALVINQHSGSSRCAAKCSSYKVIIYILLIKHSVLKRAEFQSLVQKIIVLAFIHVYTELIKYP